MSTAVTPFLWLNDNAEDAARFYITLFPNSRILSTMPGPDGKPLLVTFTLDGREYRALNGGTHYTLTEAYSFMVDCDTQKEVDDLWNKLLADGGSPIQCGWLKDRFGVTWQIVPRILGELFSSPDRQKAARVTQAMMGMVKLDIAKLKAAADGAQVH